ncbi:hypothetical protein DXH95_10040 [Sphingorhabdus pulchriflava]|uniref:Uncharacterized protein n=1 Tax=Sphingorhabdus pulchriflava TaxID=2292257 RepID=A0A371BJS1_9SPHN|nr:hypothetical protein [Sphingorhabdus pulchriflava]RDV07643.1 hypothetical protein DXH95_10040 [Sphingorhabdus pulchriflava]
MRALKVIAALAAALLTVGLVRLWLVRRALPYGEEGQYFDAASGISYSDGMVVVAGAGAIVAGVLALLLAVWAWRR